MKDYRVNVIVDVRAKNKATALKKTKKLLSKAKEKWFEETSGNVLMGAPEEIVSVSNERN